MRVASCVLSAVGLFVVASAVVAAEPGRWGLGMANITSIRDVLAERVAVPTAEIVDLGSAAATANNTDDSNLSAESLVSTQVAAALVDLRSPGIVTPPRWLYEVILDNAHTGEDETVIKARETGKAGTSKSAKADTTQHRRAPEPAGAVLALMAGLAVIWFAVDERRKRAMLTLADN